MNQDKISLQSKDGLNLYFQNWVPDGEPRGVICIVHGLGEHSGRYEHVAEFFNSAGFGVTAFDVRGHGKSGGPRGHTPAFESFMDDIAAFMQESARQFPELPLFLYGHSFGGLLVLNYALRRKPEIQGVIASAPGLKSPVTEQKLKIFLAKVLGTLMPELAMASGLNAEHISRDPEVVQKYVNDPLVHDRTSLAMAKHSIEAITWALENAMKFDLPLLIMHGDGDLITYPEGSQEFIAQVPANKTLKIWPGLYHEIHNEPEKEAVLAFALDWVNQQL